MRMFKTILLVVMTILLTQLTSMRITNHNTIAPTKIAENFPKEFTRFLDRGKTNRGFDVKKIVLPYVTPTQTPILTQSPAPVVNYIIKTITMYTINEGDKLPSDKNFGITASGKRVQANHTIAMGGSYKFGTKIKIEGFGDTIFICEDRGGAINDNIIDLYVDSYNYAIEFGRQKRKIWILQ